MFINFLKDTSRNKIFKEGMITKIMPHEPYRSQSADEQDGQHIYVQPMLSDEPYLQTVTMLHAMRSLGRTAFFVAGAKCALELFGEIHYDSAQEYTRAIQTDIYSAGTGLFHAIFGAIGMERVMRRFERAERRSPPPIPVSSLEYFLQNDTTLKSRAMYLNATNTTHSLRTGGAP